MSTSTTAPALSAADPCAPVLTPPAPNAATGPRTDSGKAISARNATTHGLFARDVVLPTLGEDPAAFDALLQRLCQQLPPRNLLERHYLEQIAAASWRLRRLHRWQAQIYEDDTLTEDQRLDKLDKTLRHETTLTRQIDRAVRTLNRDLKWLFESRASDEAHYQRDLTPAEAREEPELAIEVQRDIWRRLRPVSDADLADAPLDNTADSAMQKCENELPPNAGSPNIRPSASVTLVHPMPQAPLPCERSERMRGGEGEPRRDGGEDAAGPAALVLLGSQLPGGVKRPRLW